MRRGQAVFGTVAAVAVLLAGCSKSEDVPPGRRLFGDPPRIELVEVTPESQQTATASCEVTDMLVALLCNTTSGEFGTPPDIQFDAPVALTGTYTSATLKVKVSDPQGIENLLFVGASYVDPKCQPQPGTTCEESTVVLFDDGSENRFDQAQRDTAFGGQDCVIDETTCSCQGRVYQVTSNDAAKQDGVFTRAIPFVPISRPGILQDCVMGDHEQVPITVQGGETYSFRIDAVDREGNVDTWDTNPTVDVLPTEQTTLSCVGDACGCCLFLHPSSYLEQCGGCMGMFSPTFGAGVCSIFGGTTCNTNL